MGSGGIDSLLDISKRSLFTQSQAIRIIGNNIANVNTPGYTQRKAEIQSVEASNAIQSSLGAGSEISSVVRVIDKFINSQQVTSINNRAQAEVEDELLKRAESGFSVDRTVGRVGFELSEFFSALEDLKINPSSIPLRANVVQRGQSLVQAIGTSYNSVADLQREADSRIRLLVNDVNTLSRQIADVNAQISAGEVGGQENLTLRDQRDNLLKTLAENISFKTVENSDGTILVTLENGFALVGGSTYQDIEYTQAPSFAPVGGYPPGLDGSGLGFIVHDFDQTATAAHVNLTDIVKAGSGKLSGLLQLRGTQATTDTSPFDATGDLVTLGAHLEIIARQLLTTFNTTYRGPDEDAGTAGLQPSSGDLAGNTPGVYGLFTFSGATDNNGDGQANDLTAIGLPNYASRIQFGVNDPADLAAALDLDPLAGSLSFAPGDSSNIDRLTNLRNVSQTSTLGNLTLTGTIEEMYDLTVSYVGGVRNSSANNLLVFKDRETQINELQSSISAVSLDEEFARLINFQRAFQASARMIKVGDDLLQDILRVVG